MSLPQPDALALSHSEALRARISQAIRASKGWLSFAPYMEMALYTPGLGYYSGGAQKFGSAGDFVTAPELSGFFGRTLAIQVAQIMAASAPHILEPGAGTGALAADLLLQLEEMGSLPESYGILELSGELRQRQQATLAKRVPHLLNRLRWLDQLPDQFSGAVVANEVLDAMPVHLVRWGGTHIEERGVGLDETGQFVWQDRPATGALLSAAQCLPVPQGEADYLSEINLAATAWISAWARILQQGALLLIDYGFPAREYYHPQRSMGTLMCHCRHHAHPEPFHRPGLEDITAHVDFTAVVEAAVQGGLALLGYTGQGQFLLNCGLTRLLAEHTPPGGTGSAAYLRQAAAVQKLISPSEMGELFKVMALGRGLDEPLLGFLIGDRSHTL